jgi:hypothetical protein
MQLEQRLEAFEAKEGAQIGFLHAGAPTPDGRPRAPVGPVLGAVVMVSVVEVEIVMALRRGGEVRASPGLQGQLQFEWQDERAEYF